MEILRHFIGKKGFLIVIPNPFPFNGYFSRFFRH